jgi:thioredoxin
MSENNESDPELAAIRARRMEQLLTRQAGGTRPVPTRATPTELTSSSVSRFLAEHPRAVIDVWAPWCGPCRAMAPVLEGLAGELAPHVSFGKLNADHEPNLAAQWNVEGIPTLLLFQHGRLVDRIVGALPRDALRGQLRRVFRLGDARPTDSEAS